MTFTYCYKISPLTSYVVRTMSFAYGRFPYVIFFVLVLRPQLTGLVLGFVLSSKIERKFVLGRGHKYVL